MAGASLLTLLDDIAVVLDDVAIMTKVAAKKTTGLLGDDLALNAEQVSGVRAERELPVVWAVAKGSARNKLILVPAALAISAFIPWLITPLLMVGGAYLCYEGFEKVWHILFHDADEKQLQHAKKLEAASDPKVDLVEFEKDKIKGAIRTDFILSAEIIVIALGSVKTATFLMQASVVSVIAVIMTVGVYGLVAGIVKLDDAGLYLIKDTASNAWGGFKRSLGRGILVAAPYFMKTLSIVGTVAMFLVGGGILAHGVPVIYDGIHHASEVVKTLPLGNILTMITSTLLNAIIGIIAGAITFVGVNLLAPIIGKFRKAT